MTTLTLAVKVTFRKISSYRPIKTQDTIFEVTFPAGMQKNFQRKGQDKRQVRVTYL